MPNQYTALPPEERREATEPFRREARYKFAEARIRKIVDGAPPLTADQRRRLAALLAPGEVATR